MTPLLFLLLASLPAPQSANGAHVDEVMKSSYCASCHPTIYAEHEQNTHGRAYEDVEARLATRDFHRDNCVRCHTPRPVGETGIGMTPMVRTSNLEDGNGCMSCHWKKGYDYSTFFGGPQCKDAFDDRVGEVASCASCHRIAGTPGQWAKAKKGREAENVCLDCHMPTVKRPVAVGGPVRYVRSHVFPAARSESQIRRAYAWDARIEGNEVVVTIRNRGAGHNFPTATRQRAVDSVIVVRDAEGHEVSRSRMRLNYPYASDLQPGQLEMPVSSQIPSGQSREHRVPLRVASGTVDCRLYFKLYHPIDDDDPHLSRQLEQRAMAFDGITPSDAPVDALVRIPTPAKETSAADALSTDGMINFAYPQGGAVTIPAGTSAEDLQTLVAYLATPLPAARGKARARLLSIGAPAVPALVDALGNWNNEVFNESKHLLELMGDTAVPAVTAALGSDRLYVRYHAREVLAALEFPGDRDAVRAALVAALSSDEPLDRRGAADALATFGDPSTAGALRALLTDGDWDVVQSAALALARLDDRDSVDAVRAALSRATYPEARRDLAWALGQLGSPDGVPVLLDGLSAPDVVQRQAFFDRFFSLTGMHEGYDPGAPEVERREAVARLRNAWETGGGADALVRATPVPRERAERAWQLVETLGGGTDTAPGGDDQAILAELEEMGADAVPSLIEGFTFPSGFVAKRSFLCQALGRIGDRRAAPYLIAALRDPYLRTAEWASWALESTGDQTAFPALRRFEARIRYEADRGSTESSGAPTDELPESADVLLAHSARTRYLLGDQHARQNLVDLLLSDDEAARSLAIQALVDREGGDARGYDPAAPRDERLRAVAHWQP